MTPIRRILVPIDFSPGSEDALVSALNMAAKLGATLSLLHVHEAQTFSGSEIEDQPFTRPFMESEASVTSDMRGRLLELAKTVAKQEIPNLEVYERSGEPSTAIVATAKETAADLIVMGTHGRGGLKHFLVGSVAERVVRNATCPVLTVRLRERQSAA